MAYAIELLEKLESLYKETGVNKFTVCDYEKIDGSFEMIEKLKEEGIITEENNILQALHFTDKYIKEHLS